MKYILTLALVLTSFSAIAEEAFLRLNSTGDRARLVVLSTFAISSSAPTFHDLESVGILDTIRGRKDAIADEAESAAFKEGQALAQ